MIADIQSVFARLGGNLVDPPMVMSATLPLELSGEAIRSRLCIFTDNHNRDVALRPDLTLPLAVEEVAARKNGRSGEYTARYVSRAFRQPLTPDQPAEFIQIGCERYGYPSNPEIDAEIYTAVAQGALAGGAVAGVTHFGDLAVFDAFLNALELSSSVARTIGRAFREEGGIDAILSGEKRETNAFAKRLKDVPADDANRLVSETMDMAGIRLVGTRSLDEVVERLVEQVKDGDASSLTDEAKAMLSSLVKIDVAAEVAPEALLKTANQFGVTGIDDALEALSVRLEKIKQVAPEFLGDTRFAVSFGRRFTYYDGFVFQISDPGADLSRPFGAGGRYDELLSRISGGEVDSSAIGGVVRPDRLPVKGSK
ncbi:MAG: ATP phosphoribosyltransferase regulatory subunit [Pseudomonadota bacterium]